MGFKIWENAKNDCRQKGADLTSIRSEDENNFLSSLDFSAPVIFTGGKKDGNRFTWSDGNDFDYVNWASDWASTVNDTCIVMISGTINGDDGKWGLFQCDSALKYICKKSSKSNF